MSKKRDSGGNYGIQANSVKAGAIAVGQGATATQKIVAGTDHQALSAALDAFRAALAQSDLPAETRAVLEEDVRAIAVESEEDEPDTDLIETMLNGLASKVKLAAQLAQGAVDLIEPVRKIAAVIGVGAAAIGLL